MKDKQKEDEPVLIKMSSLKTIYKRGQRDKRKEAIAWVKALMGQTEGTNVEYADWNDIISEDHRYLIESDNLREDMATKWGIEEGAIQILIKIFDIEDNEIYDKGEE